LVNWRRLEAKVDQKIASTLGEPLCFIPVVDKDNWGNAKAAGGRYTQDVRGIMLEAGPEIQFLDGDRRISQFNGRSIVWEAWVTFDRASFDPENLPRKGDTVKTKTDTPTSFEIVDVIADGNARIACPLTRLPS
jgi:hypothetical protein